MLVHSVMNGNAPYMVKKLSPFVFVILSKWRYNTSSFVFGSKIAFVSVSKYTQVYASRLLRFQKQRRRKKDYSVETNISYHDL